MERRRHARRTPAPVDSLAQVRLRTGPELSVIDVSDWGVLVQGLVRLLPGARLDVHLIALHGRVLVRCRVVRAYVAGLRPDAIVYRGALAFDQRLDTTSRGYPLPGVQADTSGNAGTCYPSNPGRPELAS
jgi:hypothetical protein